MLKSSTRLIYVMHITWCIFGKIVFQTPYGHFEYVVMPFGLINGLAIFQHLMNDVSHKYLDDFFVYYIDDILIFSKNMEEHG